MIKKILHYLFHCPTFWRVKPAFVCPCCQATYRCYWDGHDVNGKINVCSACAPHEAFLNLEALEAENAALRALLAGKVLCDAEPFGYFRAEPFGWTDCAEIDEGARPLYDLADIDKEGA